MRTECVMACVLKSGTRGGPLTRAGSERPNLSESPLRNLEQKAVFLARVALPTWPEFPCLVFLVKFYDSQRFPLPDSS